MKRKEIIGHRMIEFEHKGNSEDQIFFLHGFGYQNKWYDELTDELSKKYEVIVPNMYGLNIFPDQPTTIDQYVDITLELSSKFKRRNQHFVGHSLGATVALLSASKNKEIKDVIAISPMMKINYKHLGFTLKYINKFSDEISKYYNGKRGRNFALKTIGPYCKNLMKDIISSHKLIKDISKFENKGFQVEQPTLVLYPTDDEFYTLTNENKKDLETSIKNLEIKGIHGQNHDWLLLNQELASRIINKEIKKFKTLK